MSKRSAPASSQAQSSSSKRNKTSHQSTMATTASPPHALKRILCIGLAGPAPGHKPPPSAKPPRGQFQQMLKATKEEAKKAGLELEIMQAKPKSFPSFLQDIRPKLESKPDGVIIGNGVRGTTEYTVFFEDLVNLCREISPRTRMAFNTSPDDILECCLRNFVA